jgi:hypothetical protein
MALATGIVANEHAFRSAEAIVSNGSIIAIATTVNQVCSICANAITTGMIGYQAR